MKRIELAFIQLKGCSGCAVSVLTSPIFSDLIKMANIRYFPMITDYFSIIEPLDYALVEGAIADKSHRDFLTGVRSKTEKVIAVGACACFGGFKSLSEKVNCISDVVKVDYFLPGCPPTRKQIGDMFSAVLSGEEFKLSNKNVCSECRFTPKFDYPIRIENFYSKEIPKKCFLEEKTLCLGPVIRAGCDALCIKQGFPCEGCNGSCNQDFVATLSEFLSLLEIPPNLESLIKNFSSKFQNQLK